MADKKIMIADTHNADSRTADSDFTIDDLREATKIHIKEVGECMDFFADKIHEAGIIHDWTKMDNFSEAYGPLVMSGVTDDEFRADPWYETHIYTERHHIDEDAKTDLNLVDVIEKICDTVTAGKGRAGHLSSKYIDVDPMLLYRAYWNTVRMLDEATEVVKEDE